MSTSRSLDEEDEPMSRHAGNRDKNFHLLDDDHSSQIDEMPLDDHPFTDNHDMGMQYIQFIYQDNVKLQQEISESTDEMIRIDNEHINERQKWER